MHDHEEFARLLDGLRAGDVTAMERMVEQYGGFLRAAVRRQMSPQMRTRFDSLDFVQDIWASLFRTQLDLGAFASPADLLRFLGRVANNKVAQVYRQRHETERRDPSREHYVDDRPEGGDGLPASTPTPSQCVSADETWNRMLEEVPAGHRDVLRRLRDGYTQEEIAHLTKVPLRTVERIVRRLKDLAGQ